MSSLDLDFEEFDGERLNRHAVRVLVTRHRAEYDELTGRFTRERIAELEQHIASLERRLADLRGMNPHGVNVPALEGTNRMLGDANDKLAAKLRKKLK